MATPAPSQFAAILRRSKFASYDPHIGQVYTTFDGNAARGNFGLKRPLALRRRNAHITVQAVDSREQQTVWRSAEPENRWIRMWDEVGVRPRLADTSAWMQKIGQTDAEVKFPTDSELTPQDLSLAKGVCVEQVVEKKEQQEREQEQEVVAEAAELGPRSDAVANLDAMSPREFERYLKRLRELRPAFRKWLSAKYNAPLGETSLFKHSLRLIDDFQKFIDTYTYRQYHQPRPSYIEQQPHRYAGLTYTHATPLQNVLTRRPYTGRIMGDHTSDRTVKYYVVAGAGMTSMLTKGSRGDDTQQVSTFRMTEARLVNAPKVVGKHPQGLEGAYIRTHVLADSPATAYRSNNPHGPGSREYIAHQLSSKTSMTQPAPTTTAQFTSTARTATNRAQALLGALSDIRAKQGIA